MTPKTPDVGHRDTDKQMRALMRRLGLSYRQAAIHLQEKLEEYFKQFAKEDAEKRALYDSGELSHEDYMSWRFRTLAITKQWKQMREQLTDDLTHQNEIAASMINDTLPDVYALNHNYGTYEAEKGSGYDTTYTLYDRSTVARLLREHDDLLPHPRVPIEKDKVWNRQHLQSALLQGILSGESMGDIAKRFQSVTDMTEKAAMRNARTAVTGAENAGRIDSYKRAVEMGIKMRQMWMAVHDGRTRDSHAIMDGEQQDVGEKFSNGCRYPGDPQGAPAEIYNCRCRTKAVVEGSDAYEKGYDPSLRPSKYLKDKGLTYEQWKEMHGERFYDRMFNSEMEHRVIGERGKEICPKAIFNRETKAFRKNGGIIIQGEDAKKHAEMTESSAAYIAGGSKIMYLLDDATITEVLEENYHYKQDMRHDHGFEVNHRTRILREIDAQRHLQEIADRYKIPIEERIETAKYLAWLLEEAEKYGYI